MTLTTEVLLFEASNDFREDPALITPALQLAFKSEGLHAPGYYGKQIEEPNTWGYIILNWDSYEKHKAMIDGNSYPAVLGALKPALGGKVEMYHVKFSDPPVALDKPVTELLILTLKTPENRAGVVEILTKISEASDKMLVFGQTREDENKYILVGGWPSVEAHWEMAARPEVAATLEKLYSLANKDHLHHTKLSQYRV